jgi:hypothetical protein
VSVKTSMRTSRPIARPEKEIETTEGGFFNLQNRDTSGRGVELPFCSDQARGQHLLKVG